MLARLPLSVRACLLHRELSGLGGNRGSMEQPGVW